MKKYNYDLGIIGGMGPEATAEIFHRIITKTKAGKDQEHMRICILNKTRIPDRTKYILENEENPLSELNLAIKQLLRLKTKSFIIACNTAHYFASELRYNSRKIAFYSIVTETSQYIKKNFSDYNVCVLATKGTVKAKIYSRELDELGINQVFLNEAEQEKIMDVIKMTKAGLSKQESLNVLQAVIEKVVKEKNKCLFVLACTELSLYKAELSHQYNIIDAMDILLERVIIANGYQLK